MTEPGPATAPRAYAPQSASILSSSRTISDCRIFCPSRWAASWVLGAQIVQFGMDAQPVRPQRVGRMCAPLWLARDLSGLGFRLPGWWRGEAGDGRGGLEPVGRPEFAQDV